MTSPTPQPRPAAPRRRSALNRAANHLVDHIVDNAPRALGAALDALLRIIDRVLGTPIPPAALAASVEQHPAAQPNPARRRTDVQAPPAKPATFTNPDPGSAPAIGTSTVSAAAPTGKPMPRSARAKQLPAGEHVVRATCTDCGDVEVASGEIHLVIYNDALDQSWYGFPCPACTARNIKFANVESRKVLIERGGVRPVFTTTTDDPNGTGRTPDQAAREALAAALPPLTADDVLDAALWLAGTDDIATAAATYDITDNR